MNRKWRWMALLALVANTILIGAGIPYYAFGFVFLENITSKLLVGLIFILAILCVFTKWSYLQRWFNILLLIFSIPLCIGLFNFMLLTPEYYLDFFISHLIGSLLIVLVVLTSSSVTEEDFQWFCCQMNWLALVIPVVIGTYLFVFIARLFMDGLYFGPSTGGVLLAFPWLISRRRFKLAIIALFIGLLGGKRAVMVSMLVECVLVFLFFSRHQVSQKVHLTKAPVFKIFAIFAGIIGTVLTLVDSNVLQNLFDLISNRIIWSIVEFDGDPNLVSAGRFDEIEVSFLAFSANPLNFLLGAGFGWSFFHGIKWLHFVHFSPLNFFYQFGGVVFTAVLVLSAKGIMGILRYVRVTRDIQATALFITFVGCLVEGLFSYMYIVNPIMWVIFGLLLWRSHVLTP